MGDNPTAGGAGDVTWTLNEILNHGPSLIYASIPGPDFVDKAINAGIGSKVKGYVGAVIDDRYAPPIKLSGMGMSIGIG